MHNIEKMVKHTLKSYIAYTIIFLKVCLSVFSILCMKKTFLSTKDHTNFELKRSNDFYGVLKKAVLKKFWQVFRSKKMHDIKRVKVLLKVIQRI